MEHPNKKPDWIKQKKSNRNNGNNNHHPSETTAVTTDNDREIQIVSIDLEMGIDGSFFDEFEYQGPEEYEKQELPTWCQECQSANSDEEDDEEPVVTIVPQPMYYEEDETGLVFINTNLSVVKDPNVFLIDTGASVNSTRNNYGLYNHQDAQGTESTMGNGSI